MDRAVAFAGSEAKLGSAIGFSQVAVNKARKRAEGPSAEMAIAIHHYTAGGVPAWALRPDIWCEGSEIPRAGNVHVEGAA